MVLPFSSPDETDDFLTRPRPPVAPPLLTVSQEIPASAQSLNHSEGSSAHAYLGQHKGLLCKLVFAITGDTGLSPHTRVSLVELYLLFSAHYQALISVSGDVARSLLLRGKAYALGPGPLGFRTFGLGSQASLGPTSQLSLCSC